MSGGTVSPSGYERHESPSDLAKFTSLLSVAREMSPAAVARTASRAIRASIFSGQTAEAVILLSALREANARRSEAGQRGLFPLRQASTTLVHSMLAANQVRQATRFTRDAMPLGEQLFKARTIDALVNRLCPQAATSKGTTSTLQAKDREREAERGKEEREGVAQTPALEPAEMAAPERPVYAARITSAVMSSSSRMAHTLAQPMHGLDVSPTADIAEDPHLLSLSDYSSRDPRLRSLGEIDPSNSTNSFHFPPAHPPDMLLQHLYLGGKGSESKPGLHPSTRLAIALLAQARRTRHKRTKQMYSRVINACLLQGEIFTASLLFAILISDWQLKQKKDMQDPTKWPADEDAEGKQEDMDRRQVQDALRRMRTIDELGLQRAEIAAALTRSKALLRKFRYRLGDLEADDDAPFPSYNMLRHIMSHLQNDHHRHTPSAERSIACMATLLHLQLMPYGYIPELLKCLYSVPKTPTPWPPPKRKEPPDRSPQTVYGHCHSVLIHLIVSLPTVEPSYRGSHRAPLRPLDLQSYNGLIHYSLRHRLSPQMAEVVVHHMQQKRKPALAADAATSTILLRSASLLRKNSEAGQIIQRLAERGGSVLETLRHVNETCGVPAAVFKFPTAAARSRQRRAWTEPETPPDAKQVQSSMSAEVASADNATSSEPAVAQDSYKPRFQRLLEKAQGHPLPELVLDAAEPRIVSRHTITDMITHLVSTDRAHLLMPLMPRFLPSLTVEQLSPEDQLEALHQSVALGPYIFSALINACAKAGKTGLAERVWRIALKAEQASWTDGPWGNAENGWWLPVQAYTSMMQVYAAEGKKGLMKYSGDSSTVWTPDPGSDSSKDLTKGWAPQHLSHRERWMTARTVGLDLARSMRKGGVYVYRRLRQVSLRSHQAADRFRDDPDAAARFRKRALPDARFFNACLDLFGRRPGMARRAVWRANASEWRRRLHRLQENKVRGLAFGDRDPFLPYILGWMRQLEFEVPPAFAHVDSKVEEDDPDMVAEMRERLRQMQSVRPFVYPERRPDWAFSPFVIPVSKDRGLPIRRGRGFAPRPAKAARRGAVARVQT